MKEGTTENQMERHREVQNRGSKKPLTNNKKCDTMNVEREECRKQRGVRFEDILYSKLWRTDDERELACEKYKG